MPKEKGHPEAAQNTQSKHRENTASSQRMRLLAALHQQPITTLMARLKLDCMHPAARIQELRQRGYQIATVRIDDITHDGKLHRVAKYVLSANP